MVDEHDNRGKSQKHYSKWFLFKAKWQMTLCLRKAKLWGKEAGPLVSVWVNIAEELTVKGLREHSAMMAMVYIWMLPYAVDWYDKI